MNRSFLCRGYPVAAMPGKQGYPDGAVFYPNRNGYRRNGRILRDIRFPYPSA